MGQAHRIHGIPRGAAAGGSARGARAALADSIAHADEAKCRCKGARCMDCGVPFCTPGRHRRHGLRLPHQQTLIPEWNDLVYRGL